MAEILLTRGFVATVDDDDLAWLTAGGKWNAGGHHDRGNVYAVRTRWVDGRSYGERMHRLILPGHAQVDHINGDNLDNRRSNLRPATASQNAANRRKRSDSHQRFKGVHSSVMPSKPWLASITVDGHYFHLGLFADDVEAAMAYDAAASQHFGEFAYLNFPKEISHV